MRLDFVQPQLWSSECGECVGFAMPPTTMSDEYMKALEVQRRNFEKQFGSISALGYKDQVKRTSDDESDSDGSENDAHHRLKTHADSESRELGLDSESENADFGGFDSDDSDDSDDSSAFSSDASSSDSEAEQPRVVRLTQDHTPLPTSKKETKLVRSGRAPTIRELEIKQQQLAKLTRKQQLAAQKEDSENLENDLKLQRLLSESHILAHNIESSGADLTLQTLDYEAPIGNSRRRILDQRIREASALNSLPSARKLEKMPMNMRKRLVKNRENAVKLHEQEALEAGIVLSKVRRGQLRDLHLGKGATLSSDRLGTGTKAKAKMRDRGLKIQSVGKSTRNGLRISASEIDRVSNMGKRKKRR